MKSWGWGLGRCWECGEALVPNEVAGVCPPCRWAWRAMHGSDAVCQLAQERVGSIVFGVGFRLGSKTQKVVHRMKYGGFPSCGRDLGRWMAKGWDLEMQTTVLRRLKHRASLTRSNRLARQEALRETFGLGERRPLPHRVVLVDDVLTTGATFRACRSVLHDAGVDVLGGVWLAMG